MERGRLKSAKDIQAYILAGNATFTLQGKRDRFTYKIRAAKEGTLHFVSVLTGSDNESSYSYLGIVGREKDFRRTAKSPIRGDAPSANAFAWFWKVVVQAGKMPAELEVWHEGKCGRCGRKLTVPESIARGIGPECAGKIGIACEAADALI